MLFSSCYYNSFLCLVFQGFGLSFGFFGGLKGLLVLLWFGGSGRGLLEWRRGAGWVEYALGWWYWWVFFVVRFRC